MLTEVSDSAGVPEAKSKSRLAAWLVTRHSRQLILLGGIISCLVLLLVFRGHWLFTSVVMNPDEAELVAAGKRAQLDLLPYQTYTTSTYLPLWPIALGILGDLGVPLNLSTAHILSGLAYVFLSVTGWHLISARYGYRWATLIVAPTAVFLFAGGVPPDVALPYDFYALGTELLPIAIVLVAAIVALTGSKRVTRARLNIASAIAGLSIWAKPQIGPLALMFVASLFLIMTLEHPTFSTSVERRRRLVTDAALIAASFAAPSGAFLLAIWGSGTMVMFHKEALATIFGYIGGANAADPNWWSRASAVGTFVMEYPLASLWALGGLLGATSRRDDLSRSARTVQFVAWALPLVGAVAVLLVLAQLFDHYAIILYAGAMLSGVVGARVFGPMPLPAKSNRSYHNVFAVLSLLGALVVAMYSFGSIGPNIGFLADAVSASMSGHPSKAVTGADTYVLGSSRIARLCPAGSRVLVWGWSPELYSYYNWQPASRYVINTWQFSPSKQQGFYQRKLVSELEQDPPRCIAEAIGPGFFGDLPSADNLPGTIPATKQLLARCYTRSTQAVGTTPMAPTPENGQELTLYMKRAACTSRQRV